MAKQGILLILHTPLITGRTQKPATKCQPEPVEGYFNTKTSFDRLNLTSLF